VSLEVLFAGKQLLAMWAGEPPLPMLHDNMLGQASLAARLEATLAWEAFPCKQECSNLKVTLSHMYTKTSDVEPEQ
jgi:hypothetical protein